MDLVQWSWEIAYCSKNYPKIVRPRICKKEIIPLLKQWNGMLLYLLVVPIRTNTFEWWKFRFEQIIGMCNLQEPVEKLFIFCYLYFWKIRWQFSINFNLFKKLMGTTKYQKIWRGNQYYKIFWWNRVCS